MRTTSDTDIGMNTMSVGKQPQTLTCAMRFNVVTRGDLLYDQLRSMVLVSGSGVQMVLYQLAGSGRPHCHSKATGAPQWADILKKAMRSWRLIATGRRS